MQAVKAKSRLLNQIMKRKKKAINYQKIFKRKEIRQTIIKMDNIKKIYWSISPVIKT